ncbi:MAG: hypothetical protein CR988_05370 [Treponema sp.]|nr:MAG: hypothetical protein CR988_05370 [Treponema sp.]
MVCFVLIFLSCNSKNIHNDEYEVIGIGTFQNAVTNPDIFFIDTPYESIKPTHILGTKSSYDSKWNKAEL